MTPAQIARVARFHASQADCTRYTKWVNRFPEQLWLTHFEYDLRRMKGRTYPRSESEVEAITEFLTAKAKP